MDTEHATKWAHLDLLVHLRHAGGRLSDPEVDSVLSYWAFHHGSHRHIVLSHLERLGLITRLPDGVAMTPTALKGPAIVMVP